MRPTEMEAAVSGSEEWSVGRCIIQAVFLLLGCLSLAADQRRNLHTALISTESM
jgi:hypothetical protein